MKKTITLVTFLLLSTFLYAQYQFPACYPEWDAAKDHYTQGEKVSLNGINYTAKWYTNAPPGDASWQSEGACGDGGLGPGYSGSQRIIGYLPTWIPDYDIKNNFNPEVVTNINISFLMFKQNNNDYNSADFGSIAFDEFQLRKVDSVLTDCNVLSKAKAKNVKVSVALGGATDFAFLWLMNKYHNNDQKLDEIANLLVTFITSRQLDGIDLDLECWWADPAIAGTSDQGGRVRGSKWGDSDQGPHPAAIGLTNLSKKLREKMPNKLISAAVFGTSWYGNNYDAKMADYMDWVGLMTYDFTGSWDKSPVGPHSSLYKVPLNTYTGQSADNPIYAAQDALEYWLGIAEPTWNHSGGFGIKKAKLVIGVPMYGYDFSEKKPNGGNGVKFTPYKDIIAEFPNAATSYDAKDPNQLNGHIGLNGKNIYYETPKRAGEKIKYTKNFGHQGVIIWELTQDVDYNSSSSILKAINEAAGNNTPINQSPVVNWSNPLQNQVFEVETLEEITLKATAVDSDGTVQTFTFKQGATVINAVQTGNEYTAGFTPGNFGEHTISAIATDDKGATLVSDVTFTVKMKSTANMPPVISMVSPSDASVIEQDVLTGIELKATVTDDTSVTSVDFMVNNVAVTPVNSNSANVYAVNWMPTAFGNYSLKIVATDNVGVTTTSTTSFTVKEKTTGGGCDSTPAWEAKIYAQAGTEVSYNGAVYRNKWYASSTETPGSSDVWEYVQSCNGEVTYCGALEWLSSKVYNTGEKVYYNQKIYRAKWWTQNNEPGVSNEWEFDSDCTQSRAEASVKGIKYPTLVKETVTFEVQSEQKVPVKAELYNVSGQLVKTIFSEENFKGTNSIQKDVSDLRNGIYIYKIYIGTQVITDKMVISK
ncbi:glycosyl hydrolase family 18 protein [Tenacibaculum sp. TC6]|uniref:glycosyl hydrolase family 18 protein n=1 Tax=Tenacibaculum sp. TC6 TaxID=3423223 RepID=UPI003D36106C